MLRHRYIYLLLVVAFFIAPYVAPSPRVNIPSDLLAASDQLLPQPVYRFTSDGCSGGLSIAWRAIFLALPPFEGCCITHDFAYWRGGSYADRMEADGQLERCVAAAGYPALGTGMRLAVWPGGSPYLPTPWRWGYGWYYLHGYDQ